VRGRARDHGHVAVVISDFAATDLNSKATLIKPVSNVLSILAKTLYGRMLVVNLYPNPTAPLIPLYPNSLKGENR
jgi:hypothetical protein